MEVMVNALSQFIAETKPDFYRKSRSPQIDPSINPVPERKITILFRVFFILFTLCYCCAILYLYCSSFFFWRRGDLS